MQVVINLLTFVFFGLSWNLQNGISLEWHHKSPSINMDLESWVPTKICYKISLCFQIFQAILENISWSQDQEKF